MQEKDWNVLVRSICSSDCILVLGPDIAVGTAELGAENKCLVEILANQLAKELEDRVDIPDPNKLLYVGQTYIDKMSRMDLQDAAAVFYGKTVGMTTKVHEDLASLPFYLIINASHDHYYKSALINSDKKGINFNCYNFRGSEHEITHEISCDNPFVYYLYGMSYEPESLVLSENDLVDYLIKVISKNPRIPSYITTEFQKTHKMFLFLGFGFKNWYLRILLQVLFGESGSRESRSFAIEQFEEQDLYSHQSIAFFQYKYKIHFFHDILLQNFTEELKRRCEKELARRQEEREKDNGRGGLPVNAPSVFICHASEDKERAKEIYEQLESKGIKPWLDRENLCVGNNWNDKIQETINEIDYFLILQSQALIRKVIGYVNREMNLARERALEFRPGIDFIIPVKIEECEILKTFQHLHTIDLIGDADIGELAKHIKRDYERRIKG